MNFRTFKNKWSHIKHDDEQAEKEEKTLYVDVGKEPMTQRQLNLYYHFLFINNIVGGKAYQDILEIGCGRGTMSQFLNRYLRKNVFLLDNTPDAIRVAEKEFADRQLDGEFHVGDALAMDFEDNRFDAVVSIGLAEHIDDLETLFAEQFRVLRPGGVMVSLNIPKKISVQNLNTVMRFFKKIFGSYKENIRTDYYRNELTPKEYEAIAQDVGFEKTDITCVCPFPVYTPIEMSTDRTITKINKWILKLRSLFMKYTYKTNRLVAQAHFLVAYKPENADTRPTVETMEESGKATDQPDAIWKKIQNGTFIIAEAGKNFIQTKEDRSVEEYLKNAKQLVDEAVKAGADAIKWQTHNVEDEQLNLDITSPHFKGSDRYSWVKRNTDATPLEAFWKPLKAYCDKKGIIFMSTPMSRGAAKKLDAVGVDIWKVGSGDILDFVTLDYLRESGKPIIFSTGMSTLEEAESALAFIREKNDRVVVLHCVSKYPCPPEDLRLGTIDFYKKHFNAPIGFSDHSIGIESAIVAAAMGAQVIEKHFSMSRDLWGADHKVSMTPEELTALVQGVQDVLTDSQKKQQVLESDFAKKAREKSEKTLQEDEAVFRPLFRKALMAGKDIPAGTIITKDMLYAMRPQQYAGGLPSEEYSNVLGKKIVKEIKKFDPITWDALEK